FREFREGNQRANSQSGFCVKGRSMQLFQIFDVDEALGTNNVILHERQQVGAAGQYFSISPVLSQQLDYLLLLLWTGVFKGPHARPPAAFSSASSTRSGVSGSMGTRTPMALATALEIAAPGETVGGSPNPITPRSSSPGPDIMWTTNSPTSPRPA